MANYILGTLKGLQGGNVISGTLGGLVAPYGTVDNPLPYPDYPSYSAVRGSTGMIATLSGELAGLDGLLVGGEKYEELLGELHGLEGTITAYTDQFGHLEGNLSGLYGDITASFNFSGKIDHELVGLTGSITATTSNIAIISGTLKGLTGSITGHFICNGEILGTLAGLNGEIVSLGQVYTIVLNPMLKGVTEYSNFSFDSYYEYEGNYYASNTSGNYQLTGTTDANTAITGTLESGRSTLDYVGEKNIPDVFVLSKVNGGIDLTLYADDSSSGQTYTANGTGSVKNLRFKCALGVVGFEWRWKLTNKSGVNFDVRHMNILEKNLKRKA